MPQEILCTGTTENIADLIAQCQFPPDAFLLVERLPPQVVSSDEEREHLLRFARLGDPDINVAYYTSGRIFTRAFELRWEQKNGITTVIYLGEPRAIPGLQQQKGEFELVGKPKRYYLFGQRLDDLAALGRARGSEDYTYYAEVRIPRLLRYPLAASVAEQAQWAQLLIGEYHSPEHGQLFRFQDVQPARDDGGSV